MSSKKTTRLVVLATPRMKSVSLSRAEFRRRCDLAGSDRLHLKHLVDQDTHRDLPATRTSRALEDDDDGLVGHLCGLETQAEAEIDDWNDFAAEIDDPSHECTGARHPCDLQHSNDFTYLLDSDIVRFLPEEERHVLAVQRRRPGIRVGSVEWPSSVGRVLNVHKPPWTRHRAPGVPEALANLTARDRPATGSGFHAGNRQLPRPTSLESPPTERAAPGPRTVTGGRLPYVDLTTVAQNPGSQRDSADDPLLSFPSTLAGPRALCSWP